MDLKECMHRMKSLIDGMNVDLKKTARGNKTAAQRVRTATVVFAKIAKHFRKESVFIGKKQR
jgi:hypothetical protein